MQRIPRGPHLLEAMVTRPHRPPLSDVTVTNPARIRRFASLIDRLKAVGPSALDCAGSGFRASSAPDALLVLLRLIAA